MKKASIFVSLSEYEGQPNSVIQSLGCGTKTLIKLFPGLGKEIKHSKDLIIVNKLEKTIISKSIIQNIISKKDKKFNKNIINIFSEKQYVNKIIKLIYE